jgi:hypothetical protein
MGGILKKLFCLLILAFNMAFAEQTVAILPSDGTLDADENELLTDKMREAALNGYWWSASEDEYISNHAYGREMNNNHSYVLSIGSLMSHLYSVRCLQD